MKSCSVNDLSIIFLTPVLVNIMIDIPEVTVNKYRDSY